MVEAEMLVDIASRGVTKPKFFHCSDNNIYLVKFDYPIENNRILLHEFFAYQLADLLQLPMPTMSLVHISQELCNMYSGIEGLTPGVKIGFLKEDIEDNSTSSGTLKEPYVKLFSKISNSSVFPDLLAFDSLIHNFDRTGNDGNFILTSIGFNRYEMKLIDHGHAFFGPSASPQRLHLLRTYAEVDMNLVGVVYDAIKYQIDLTDGENPFLSIINRIESLNPQHLNMICSSIPSSWSIDTIEKEALTHFILSRRFKVKYLINHLVNAGYFPIWTKEALPWSGLLASSL
ncbi:HipA family kinase [Ectobacillus ponti]|uniref:HipA-like kinase domain-containing protein n=1 Tax=Ectobacillus ponti TaxID=2961894 RepID=A0AA41XBR5_9BACI|nr:HipA family kinase [Ectobacillus ponti]MCP8970535.1 hypothetical protein [Ectobacillus ponti]